MDGSGSTRVGRGVVFLSSLRTTGGRRDCSDTAPPDDDAHRDPANEPAQIGHVVCPEVGIESMEHMFRDGRRVVLHAETLQKVASDSGGQSAQGHNDQKPE